MTELQPEAEGWLVFSRASISEAYGLTRSKRGVWWVRVGNEQEAKNLRIRIGSSAWAAPIEKLKQRKSRILYRPPSSHELADRAVRRQRALKDFAAGTDWPPW